MTTKCNQVKGLDVSEVRGDLRRLHQAISTITEDTYPEVSLQVQAYYDKYSALYEGLLSGEGYTYNADKVLTSVLCRLHEYLHFINKCKPHLYNHPDTERVKAIAKYYEVVSVIKPLRVYVGKFDLYIG